MSAFQQGGLADGVTYDLGRKPVALIGNAGIVILTEFERILCHCHSIKWLFSSFLFEDGSH